MGNYSYIRTFLPGADRKILWSGGLKYGELNVRPAPSILAYERTNVRNSQLGWQYRRLTGVLLRSYVPSLMSNRLPELWRLPIRFCGSSNAVQRRQLSAYERRNVRVSVVRPNRKNKCKIQLYFRTFLHRREARNVAAAQAARS